MKRSGAFQSILFILLIFIDQTSKYIIRQSGGFYICNENMAWGIKIPTVFFWIVWIFVIFFMMYLFLKVSKIGKNRNWTRIGLILILAGAFSNFWDRILAGCITDFIDFGFWPIFNLADSFIVFGAIILLAKYLKI